jgi:adenylate cyclase
MIVDDDEQLCLQLERTLSLRGYQVSRHPDPGTLKDAVAAVKPDILLLDLHLGHVNGIELLGPLLDSFRDLIVVMMSADMDPQNVFLGLFEGADDFLLKPVLPDELDLRLRNLLQKREYMSGIQKLNEKLELERRLLLRYFSPQTAEHLLSGMIDANLRGGLHDITVLFFGVRNASRRQRTSSAQEFASFLNTLLVDIMDQVASAGGSVNKLNGAGLLATFGLPFSSEDDAARAVQCAHNIRAHVHVLNEVSVFGEPIRFGMGLCSGPVFAGNIGSFFRMEYSVIGDIVNIASRLESLARSEGGQILSDLATVERAGLQAIHAPGMLRGRKGEVPVCEI